jgi:PCFT/HCP family folate transporter-like MFS transporter 1/3
MTRQHSPSSPLSFSTTTTHLVAMLEETTPLLGRQQKATRWLSLCWLSAVVFCLSAAGAFLNVPLTRLIEDRLCSRYVRQGAPAEELCKTDKIQSMLAYLNGCLPVVEAVVGTYYMGDCLPLLQSVRR